MRPLLFAALVGALWAPQKSGVEAQLRGLAVLDGHHAWASGEKGTVLRTRDGESWEKVAVPGGGELDFRDVEALDAKTVLLLSAGTGGASRIYRSTDGGATWTLLHTNPDPAGFYDAIAFWDAKRGIVLGDPVDGRFVVRLTDDGGSTWRVPPPGAMPAAMPGEGAFAAGGTCLTVRKGGAEAWFVTGGARVSRAYRTKDGGLSWSSAAVPVPAGNASSGLFSVAFLDARRGFVSGGDYKQPDLAALNGARTEDGGRTWKPSPIAASGFFSALAVLPWEPESLFAVGPGGSAVSRDAGRSWSSVDKTPLNSVAFADRAGWAVGPKGTVVRFTSSPR
jgi:photosystem II stability/assembly factor-like uncharacterized protein